jgi:FMN reductase
VIERNGTGPPVRMLGIGGSTRLGSTSLAALRAALRLAEEAGAETALADVRTLALPLYDEDRALVDYPASLDRLLAEARAADAYVLCTPTYLGTIAGAVKNVLDLLSFLANDAPPYLGGRPVGLVAVGGANAAQALVALQQAAQSLHGLVVPTAVTVPRWAIGAEGEGLEDEAIRRRMQRMTGELIDVGRRLRRPALVEAE